MQEPRLDAADGHPQVFGVECEFQKRAGADHVQRGHLFPKITQGQDGLRAFLDLVEKEERPARHDERPAQHRDAVEDRLRLQGVEAMAISRLLLEVDGRRVLEPPLGERPDRPGLADLPGAADQEREAALVVNPCVEGVIQNPVHQYLSPCGLHEVTLRIGENQGLKTPIDG